MIRNPEQDITIVALEREEAYETAAHHSEQRRRAEHNEQQQISRVRLLLPKAYAFSYIERCLTQRLLGNPETDSELVELIEERIKLANREIEGIVAGDPDTMRIHQGWAPG